jgi:hypothetical protein
VRQSGSSLSCSKYGDLVELGGTKAFGGSEGRVMSDEKAAGSAAFFYVCCC